MKSLFSTIGLAVIAALAFAGPAAATEIPFEAGGHRVHLSVEKAHGGLHVISAIPDGESSLGDWEGIADLHVQGANSAGTLVMTFASGDTLTVAVEQHWTSDVGDFGGTEGEFVITGGTGRLAGASGGGAITAFYLDKKGAEVLVTLQGTIELP